MGILQARILEWVASSFSRGSSQPRDRTVSCIAGRFFIICATREVLCDELEGWNFGGGGKEAQTEGIYVYI